MPKGKAETQEEYRQRIMEVVCGCLAEGKSLRQICRSVEGMPNQATICHWLAENETFAKQYARAREMLTDVRFDEFRDAAAEIVKDCLAQGWEPKDAIQYARLQTGNMQWEISKLNPKKYGDKMTLAGDAENPLAVKIDELSELERANRIAALLNAARTRGVGQPTNGECP